MFLIQEYEKIEIMAYMGCAEAKGLSQGCSVNNN